MNEPVHAASPLYPAPATGSAPLRIGLLLDSVNVPAWVARLVEEIQACGFARVVVAIIDTRGHPVRRRPILHDIYTRLEIRVRRDADSPFIDRDLTPLLREADRLHAHPALEQGSLTLPAAELDRLRTACLDVLLRFGLEGDLSDDLLAVAVHGVWSHAHGNSPEAGGHPGLFRAIRQGIPITAAELWQSLPATAPRLLYRSHGATHPHSLEIGQQSACSKASSFVMRCLRRLANAEPLSREPPQPQAPRDPPGNLQMGGFLARNLMHQARALVRNRASVEHWSVLWRRSGTLLDPDRPDFEGARPVPCPRGHFYADPFLFRHEGEDWLFLEDYDYALGKADIVAMRIGPDGPMGGACTALRLEEHLSYPCIFEWRGQVYMMPEIGDMGGPVRLFRARRFPDDWEFACELLSGRNAVDATLHEHEGRWYLFVNIRESPGASENDELFLFHAETPFGPFQPHSRNPVVSDVRHARPAGRIFRHAGRWIRPSQDCAGGYGRAVVFNEILELTPLRYSERPLGRLAPCASYHAVGCHTYAALGDLEVIDLKHRRYRSSVGA
ncbi:MAG: hypothetical protein JSS21_02060 [Proteobacteria bacterium]|nr:hypothetical protein [Pseudomonadota bacterium]